MQNRLRRHFKAERGLITNRHDITRKMDILAPRLVQAFALVERGVPPDALTREERPFIDPQPRDPKNAEFIRSAPVATG